MRTEHLSDLEKLLKLQEGLHGPNSSQVAKVLVRLANVHLEQHELDKAEPLYKRALLIEGYADQPAADQIRIHLQKLAAKRSTDFTDDPANLKISSDRIPTFTTPLEPIQPDKSAVSDEAFLAAKKQVEQLRLVPNNQTGALADALTKLADVYCRHKMLDEMEPLLLEALQVRETVYGTSHLSITTDLKNIARLYYVMGQYEIAEPLLQRAISIREAALGRFHPHVGDVAEWYARVLRKINRIDEAQEMEALVLEIGTKHGSDWDKYKTAGLAAVSEGNLFIAQALWLAALDETKAFRFDDPRLSASLENLAEVYWKRGKFEKAEPLCKQILQISESVLGPEHADVALAANNLALVCERQGKYVEAALLYQQALSINEKLFGHTHPDTLAVRDSHTKARQMAQRQVELKVGKAEGRWNRSGWWRAMHGGEVSD